MRSLLAKRPAVKIGDSFGRLEVLGAPFMLRRQRKPGGKIKHGQAVVCQCKCGTVTAIKIESLRAGTKSCGCLKKINGALASTTHGDSRDVGRRQLYTKWLNIRNRCGRPSDARFQFYGARGITVCDEWKNDYLAFRSWAIANAYETGLELDRIDNDGPYAPQNCRFVTKIQNMRNRSDNLLVSAFGETKTAIDWSEDDRCVVSYHTLFARLKRGVDSESAITALRYRVKVI